MALSRKQRYLNQRAECLSAGALKKLQLTKAVDLFKRARKKSPFYRDFLEEHGAHNTQIKSLEDLQKIPIMGKEQARQAYPDKLCMVGPKERAQVHGSSGTTGKSTLTFATRKDMELWAERNGRNMWSIGLRPGDSFMRVGGYGLATGGFGFHYGAAYIGATVVPTGVGQALQKLDLIEDLKVTCLGDGPSFLAYMAQLAHERDYRFDEKPYPKIVLFGGQPTPQTTRKKIEEYFGCKAYDEYGLTELLGPGMACECQSREGLHVWSDHILVEVVDPRTGEWVPRGEEGELVWTFLVSEAMAIIRYRSGDLSRIIPEPCSCGRTGVRIANVKGRVDAGVSIGGYVIFPSTIEDVLFRCKEVGSNFQCIVDTDPRGLDRLTINLEVSDRSILADERGRADLSRRVMEDVKSYLGVTPKELNLVEPDSLPVAKDDQSKTTNIRIVDRRKNL
jgi:phenylacetate-CoA ligase